MNYDYSPNYRKDSPKNKYTDNLDPHYRKKDYAGYVGALVVCAIVLGVVMWQVYVEKVIERAQFMAHCAMCHPPAPDPIIKTLNDYKAFHQKKKTARSAKIRIKMAEQAWLDKELLSH